MSTARMTSVGLNTRAADRMSPRSTTRAAMTNATGRKMYWTRVSVATTARTRNTDCVRAVGRSSATTPARIANSAIVTPRASAVR